jgi:hypothetical protein
MDVDESIAPNTAGSTGTAGGEVEPSLDERVRAWREADARRYQQLRRHARGVYRAMEGWAAVPDEEAWHQTWLQARDDYRSGRFLLERLGAERYLDPPLMATLWSLRQELIEDLGATGAHELMLVDTAVLSYYHLLRFNGWVGNFALMIEHEFFGQESPTAKHQQLYGRPYDSGRDGLRVEEYVQRVGEQLIPLMDRSQRMLIRALRELRRSPSASVAIGQAGQVNVGTVQQNAAEIADVAAVRPNTGRQRART